MRKHLGKSIVFMDKDCLEYAEQEYKTAISRDAIVKLGYDIEELNDEVINARCQNRRVFRILSVSRFDFPTKGYQLGLIEAMPELIKKYPNVSLEVIGSDEVKHAITGDVVFIEKLNAVPELVRKNITWIKKVEYSNLRTFYESANLLVGMGSTVLEASSYGLPSIVVAYNTTQLEPIGFFHDNSDVIGEASKPDTHRESFSELVGKIYNMDNEKYLITQRKTYEMYAREYSIDRVMETLLKLDNDDVRVTVFLSIFNAGITKIKRWYDRLTHK